MFANLFFQLFNIECLIDIVENYFQLKMKNEKLIKAFILCNEII